MNCHQYFAIRRDYCVIQFDENGFSICHFPDRDEGAANARELKKAGSIDARDLIGGQLPAARRKQIVTELRQIPEAFLNEQDGYWFALKDNAQLIRDALSDEIKRFVGTRGFTPFYDCNELRRRSQPDISVNAPAPIGGTVSGKD